MSMGFMESKAAVRQARATGVVLLLLSVGLFWLVRRHLTDGWELVAGVVFGIIAAVLFLGGLLVLLLSSSSRPSK
jgi:hypothetical protein